MNGLRVSVRAHKLTSQPILFTNFLDVYLYARPIRVYIIVCNARRLQSQQCIAQINKIFMVGKSEIFCFFFFVLQLHVCAVRTAVYLNGSGNVADAVLDL